MTVPLHIFSHLHTDMGEKVYAQKFCAALRMPYHSYDIPSFLGPDYPSLATINLNLASEGYSPCVSGYHQISQSWQGRAIILSWASGLAALHATGILEQMHAITKLYVHQPNERIPTTLYESSDLVITESLLASQRAKESGLSRRLYIPHHYIDANPIADPNYLKRLSMRLQKSLPPAALVLGSISRLEYWKNPEFAIEAVGRLAKKQSLIFVLKGDFPKQSVYPDYEARLLEMITYYAQEPWFFWDRSWTPYPQVLSEYACFDVLIQPSGAEGASNLIVDLLAMGKPVIALEASTNPYLFHGGVVFTAPEPDLQVAQLAYARPQLESLLQALERLCNLNEREQVSQRARTLAQQRFHPSYSSQRIARMTESSYTQAELETIEQEDRIQYHLD